MTSGASTTERDKTLDGLPRAGRNTESLRIRAAWLYYVEQRTQSDIAQLLNVGRVTVVRMLADARARGEVRITITGDLSDITDLERSLEDAFELQQAIVVPIADPDADPVPAISAGVGRLMGSIVKSRMRIGVGWGRTLYSSLPYIESQKLEDLRVISLLGGIIQARRFNPAEFAWQFAELFHGEGFLIPAPALVDSTTTRDSLINHCGIDTILQMATDLDAVLLSVGGLEAATTTFRVGYLSANERRSLQAAGAVGDLLFHHFDAAGNVVDHEINQRIVSVGIDALRQVPLRIMASGGKEKIDALMGVMALVNPTVLVTDEFSAGAMLQRRAV